jgi:GTP-binding protein
MKINTAKFLISNTDIEKCPKDYFPEFAFIGRSNVGKSSLINMLCGVKNLAKASSTPGRTRLINHFVINSNTFFVDLPGYGYAKASHTLIEQFQKLTLDYLLKRKNLACLFALIDGRLPLQPIDDDFFTWCAKKKIPFAIVLTKCDKLTKNELNKNIRAIENALYVKWQELPPIFITSATNKIGKDDLLEYIGSIK